MNAAADDHELVALGERIVESDPREAARLFARAARIAERRSAWSHAVAARQREVGALGRAGRRRDAEVAADRALELLEHLDDPLTPLTSRSNLAVGLLDAGSVTRAAGILDDVIAVARALDETPETMRLLAAALVNRATIIVDGRGPGLADSLLEEAERFARALGDDVRVGTVLVNQAAYASKRHDLTRARDLYVRAGQAFRDGGAAPGDEGSALRGEAATLAAAGRYREAIERYGEATKLFEIAGLRSEVRTTQIGAVMARHSLAETIPLDELRAMAGWLADLPPISAGQLAMNLANIAQQQGHHDLEELLRRRAKRAFTAGGARADAARVDLGRAVSLRRAGRLDRARVVIRAARKILEEEGRWLNVAHADHNLALVLEELADRHEPSRRALLAQAAERSVMALAALDRYRHSMPSPADRRAIGEATYPGMFALAVRMNLRAGRQDLVAAIVERARMQPVLARRDDATRLLDPAPLGARSDSAVVGGAGEPVVLEREAERLVGADARWLGWWSDRVDLVRSETGPEKVVVDVLPLDPSALDALAMALPHVRAEDLQVAGDDRAVARRLALWRAARGPLVDDERLAAAVERDLVPSLIEDVAQRPDFDRQAASTSDELLWPLSRMLLGDALLERLCGEPDGGARWSLAVAPPPLLGRIPWAALPLKDPSERDCVPTLVERADLVVAVPASLSAAMARNASGVRSGATMLVLDPREDLLFARAIQLEGARILRGRAEATRDAVLAALKAKPAIAAFAAHVRAGGDDDPAASAILLADSAGGTAPLGVGDLAKIQAPPVCVLLVCDGAGAATGAEWTGVATGLLWAGAGWVVTTTAAVIDDRLSPELDSELLLAIAELGPLDGLWSWQRRCAQRRRDDTDPRYAPYRWANFVALACGSRDSAVATG